MKTVVGGGLPLPAQAAECSGEAAAVCPGSGAKNAMQMQGGKQESPFTKLFVQGIAQSEKTEVDQMRGAAEGGETRRSEEEEDTCGTSAVSGMLAQLLMMQPLNSGAGPDIRAEVPADRLTEIRAGDLAEVCIDHPTEVCAVSQPEQKAAGESIALQGPAEKHAGGPALKNQGKRPEVSAAPPVFPASDEESIRMPAAPALSAERSPQEQQPEQSAKPPGGQEVPPPAQSDAARTILETVKAVMEEDGAEPPFREFAPGEEKTGFDDTAVQGDTAAGFLPDSTWAAGSEPVSKSVSVTRALNRFVDEFRAVEADSREIRIVLEPEHYGTLTISVSRKKDGISAIIRSEEREVCAVITQQIQKLIASMESKGIAVEDVDVVFGGMEQNLSFSQNGSGGRKERSSGYSVKPGEKTGVSDSAGFFDLWYHPAPGAGELSGTVEYRI